MSLMTRWLTLCSDCLNYFNPANDSPSQLSDYYINIHELANHCLHISNRKDSICYSCFRNFFGYDRFIVRRLFSYLNPQQADYIHIREFSLFAERIIHWQEFINHIEFILQLFQIILNINITMKDYSLANLVDLIEKHSIDSLLLYELIQDAFFFTAIQSHVQTNMTDQSQVSCRFVMRVSVGHSLASSSSSLDFNYSPVFRFD